MADTRRVLVSTNPPPRSPHAFHPSSSYPDFYPNCRSPPFGKYILTVGNNDNPPQEFYYCSRKMRRSRDIVLRAGLYVVAAISGVAAAYVLKELILNFRGLSPNSDPSNDDDGDEANTDSKRGLVTDPDATEPHSRSDDSLPINGSSESPLSDHTITAPTPTSSRSGYLFPSPDEPAPTADAITGLSRTLSPLRMPSPSPTTVAHPLPTPVSLAESLSPATSSTTFFTPLSSSQTWQMVESQDADPSADATWEAQCGSPTAQEPHVNVLSPSPGYIPARRGIRAHDLFATSHVSFSELGSLMGGEGEGNRGVD
ncbi:hypothetical protein HYDPIDRAFT_115696 [Hydnomerulius pinastri MD-312]|uniref:Unplaced genomic scaffold scaffold_27, whole genome shotgun sequence n=1 Tax=Hydnomerulius pinastri MD-312 TaxID=994086 RepID=A0A0C9VU57_9AGAM|nr:hypothetical protein HYDPIDRAFT_115696 [Hydnomerulius pinastri MD-312]